MGQEQSELNKLLCGAVERNDIKLATSLLERGADVYTCTEGGFGVCG